MTYTTSLSASDDLFDEDTVRSLTILNLSGDSTLAWGPKNDDVMREIIERKMKEGFAFFVLKKRLGGLLGERKVRVTDLDKAMESRSLVMADEDFAAIVTEGGVQLVRTPDRGGMGTGDAMLSRDPAQIASGQSVAVRQMKGG